MILYPWRLSLALTIEKSIRIHFFWGGETNHAELGHYSISFISQFNFPSIRFHQSFCHLILHPYFTLTLLSGQNKTSDDKRFERDVRWITINSSKRRLIVSKQLTSSSLESYLLSIKFLNEIICNPENLMQSGICSTVQRK